MMILCFYLIGTVLVMVFGFMFQAYMITKNLARRVYTIMDLVCLLVAAVGSWFTLLCAFVACLIGLLIEWTNEHGNNKLFKL